MLYKITIEKVYTIDTLPTDIREKVINDFRYMNVEDKWWYEDVIENWKDKLKQMGFIKPVISFSGFYSQGDGASFITNDINLEIYLKMHRLGNRYRAAFNAAKKGYTQLSINRNSHHYVHERTINIINETFNVSEKVQLQLTNLCNHVAETIRKISKQIYKELQEIYEHYTSDKVIAESLQDGRYQFNAIGKKI